MSEEPQQSISQTPISDFPLPDPQGQRQYRRRSRGRIKRWYSKIRRRIHLRTSFVFIISIAVIATMVMTVYIVDASAKLDSSWLSMNRILESIESRQGTDLTLKDFSRVRVGIAELDQQIYTTRKRFGLLSPFFKLNDQWQASFDLLDASSLMASSAYDMVEGVEPIINYLVQGENNEAIASQLSSGERIVDLLNIGLGSFRDASELLAQAKEILDSMNLANASSDIILSREQILSYYQRLNTINSILLGGPDILTQMMGVNEEATYLLLAQNNDELRPSGGYIGTYGWFTVRNGRVTDFDFSPTTATNPHPPAESFVNTFEVPDWWLKFQNPIYAAWDGSWYADFPSTAQLALNYYNEGQNPHAPVDGVIAIDTYSFEQILAILGKITVPDYDRDVTADNFREVFYDVQTYGSEEHERFLVALYRTIFEEWQNLKQDRSGDMLATLIEALTQRHVMIYVPDQSAENVINLLGWSGAQIAPDSTDYLLVADTNLSNKSNNSVIRSMTYDVEIHPDQSRLSNLRVRYDYFDSVAKNDPAINPQYHGPVDYKTLTQIYLPDNVNVLEEDNLKQSSVNKWENYTLVVSRVDVDYDTSERIQLSYETPAIQESPESFYKYRLLIQKQPGSQVQNVNLQIKLPKNASIISLSPAVDASYELEQPILDYRLQLASDQSVEVVYSLNP